MSSSSSGGLPSLLKLASYRERVMSGEETPGEERFRVYHVERQKQGVRTVYAASLAVNMVMGSGFLALPFAFARAGLALSVAVVLIVTGCMYLTCGWEAEAMSRAEALESYRLCEHTPALQLALSDRTFEVVELCDMFGGHRLRAGYSILFLVFLLTTSWAYAFVFAEALSTEVPLFGLDVCSPDDPCHLYTAYAVVFLVIAVPLCVFEPSEMIEFQFFMTILRVVIAVAMSTTALIALYSARDLFPAEARDHTITTTTTPLSLKVRYSNLAGLKDLLPAAVFALNLNGSVPLVAKSMAKRDDLSAAILAGLALPCAMYILIGASVAAYFGRAVPKSANVAWENFMDTYGPNGPPLWAVTLRAAIVLFPAIDIISVYPLNATVIANNLIAICAGQGDVDRAQRDPKLRRVTRAFVAVPPIVAAIFFSNFIRIIDYCGILAVFVSCLFPPLLAVMSQRTCRHEFGDGRMDTTPFALDGPGFAAKILVVALGAAVTAAIFA